MNPRYRVPIPIAEARTFLKLHFGNQTRIPWGSRCYWIAGLRYVSDQPGCYLIGGSGGLCGVEVQPKAKEGSVAA